MKFSLSFKFVVGCSLILLSLLGATFYVINERQEQLIIRQAENEARAVFQQIVIMRKWIADHGGVFVEKLPWVQSNQFLTDPEIVDDQSRHYTRKTPAMVTKELADYARDEGLYWFHITSLKLTNPENVPDDFERQALERFEREPVHEIFTVETIKGNAFLRYISPLYVEDACLGCHRRQGYGVGDIRGAISVTLPLGKIFAEAAINRRTMFVSMLLVVVVLSGALIYMTRYLVLAPMRKLSGSISALSSGNYSAGTILHTGDEFETLSRAFVEMASRLHEYHEGLQDKIHAATLDLEAANDRLRDANERLRLASDRKSDFIARAAHELRTPLTSIKGAMEYVTARLAGVGQPSSHTQDMDELLDFFQIIQKNTDRIIRMVNTMLDLERIEMGAESVLQRSPVDLVQILQECVMGFSLAAARRQVRLGVEPCPLPPVSVDEDRIRQVVINLLANAVKFAPDHSSVRIRATRMGDVVRVEVLDEGPGIASHEREKVFEKFYRSGGKEGSGLGLAICRTIIEAHGGSIAVAEQEGGAGACVYFTLPIASGGTDTLAGSSSASVVASG